MKRRSFFKKLGIGAAALAVAPKIIEASEEIPAWEVDIVEVSKDLGIRPFIPAYPETYEECNWKPKTVTTTTNVSKVGDGLYEVGLSEAVFPGFDLICPGVDGEPPVTCKFINEKPGDYLSTSGPIYQIAAYDISKDLSGIKIGTKLLIGGSSFREIDCNDEIITRSFKTRSGDNWTITELKSFSNE